MKYKQLDDLKEALRYKVVVLPLYIVLLYHPNSYICTEQLHT